MRKTPIPSSATALGAAMPAVYAATVQAIRVRHLTKRYGETLAVDDIDFDVPPGATFRVIAVVRGPAVLVPVSTGVTALAAMVPDTTYATTASILTSPLDRWRVMSGHLCHG